LLERLVEGGGGKNNHHNHSSSPENPRIPAVVYVARNCVPYRQRAAQLLAEEFRARPAAASPEAPSENESGSSRRRLLDREAIRNHLNEKETGITGDDDTSTPTVLPERGFVHHGGSCLVPGSIPVPPGVTNGFENGNREQFHFNYKTVFTRYKYCLVMENTKSDGYITEKLLHGLLGGCLPIYYGTREVYDLFRSDAFVYYDIDDPEPAIDEIRRLEADDKEYDFRTDRSRPLLKSTLETLDRYFSGYPGVGNGRLCREIHEMMGLPVPAALLPPPTRWGWGWSLFRSS